MKTLHFFTEYYYPAENSTSFYITRIIRSCAEVWNGILRVYCAVENSGEEQLTGENVKILRFGGGKLNKNSLISRLFKFFLITLKFSSAALLKVKKGDTVFSVTNPAFMLVFLAFLRKIRRYRFVLLVYDIFPEVLIPAGLVTERSLKYRLSLKIFNWAYNSADTLIVIGRDMQEVVEKKIKNPKKIVFIPNWSDTENITPIPKVENPILKRLGVENKFVFSVAGNMGRTQGLENILTALSQKCLAPETVFLFMGGGAKLAQLQSRVKSEKLDNVLFTGWIPTEEQNAMLSACDVAVISLAEGMYGLSVPSKSYFNMAAGKPLLLIADEKSEIARIIEEKGIGWFVATDKIEELGRKLKEISILSPVLLTEMAVKSRLTAEHDYPEKIMLQRYRTTICEECSQE